MDKKEEVSNKRKSWRGENKTTDYKEDDLQMGDVFDVTKEVLVVHSPISTINPDFILSDLDPKLLDNPLVTYVREQLKNIEAINIHLSSERLKDENWRLKINQLLLNELYSLIIISRPKDGRVIRAILEYIKGNAGGSVSNTPLETEEQPQKTGILQKINPFKTRKPINNSINTSG